MQNDVLTALENLWIFFLANKTELMKLVNF